MLDPQNYESTEKLSDEALLEKGSEYQVEIDGLESDLEDLKAKATGKKSKLKRFAAHIAKIFHAREMGADLYLLNDGGLTEEAPDLEGSLPLGDAPERGPEEPPEEGLPLEEATETLSPGEDATYPAQQAGQIYQAKGTAKNTLTVKESPRGWTGRVSGKPVAIDRETAKQAMSDVEDYLKEEYALDWKPTIEITEISEEEGDEVGVEL